MAQVFTCTDLIHARHRMESMWADANYRRAIQPEVEFVKALKLMQTADLSLFSQRDEKAKVKIYWTEACEGTVQDCTTDCNFTGTAVSSNCKDYEISQCKETILTIDDSPFYDNYENFMNAAAKGFDKHLTLLDNWIETQTIAALDSFAGTNQYNGDSRAQVVLTDTFIDGPFWTASLMSYFEKVKRLNYMPEAIMMSGENMFDAFWNAQEDGVNANGGGAKNKFNKFNWFFDIANMDTVLGSEKTLMVSPHAAAFVSTNRVTANVDKPNKDIEAIFTMASPNIPGVVYDVYYTTSCKNAGEDTIHNWRFVARFDIFQSPVICANDATGVLSFDCGVAP